MKKTFFILALLIVSVVVAIFFFYHQDERQIRRNISSLLASISALIEDDGIAALIEARKIGSLFTEYCQIVVGEPVPEIHGRQALISAAYGVTRRVVAYEVKVAFYDVSVTVAENGIMAISIKTVVVTGAPGREIRNIKMHWEKIDGRWEIAIAKLIPILY